MLSPEEKTYYDRQLKLPGFGIEHQLKLKNANILVIGAGGLGCPALQYLIAAGVGKTTIIDDDVVDISNLHRQILYTIDAIDQPKAHVAKAKLKRLNPFVKVEAIQDRLTNENALDLIGDVDLVMDCSDNFPTRYLVNDACVISKKPFIYGGINQFSGQLSVFNYNGGPTYRCLFPDPPNLNEAPNCSEVGVLGILPGIIGNYQALEAIKVLTGIGEPLSGSLLVIDTLTQNQQQFTIHTVAKNLALTELKNDYQDKCSTMIEQINYTEYQTRKLFLLDVREVYEYEMRNIGGLLIPLNELPTRLSDLPKDQEIAVLCAHGVRSMHACEYLLNEGYKVCNLEGGISVI
ncbi:MAG: molybdopterin/thiamine biosynthesis adenylyltransferase/rhodanese-related sulfurtransferase [Flavobacteriaceae bacterium]|jgi:molybdopterin/thiamine biosynthesis adenylyltransferase/rhodanese-related sulfurtransferase